MNNRIKDLYILADRFALDKANNTPHAEFEYTYDDDMLGKFAELIVRECFDQIHKQSRGPCGDYHGEWYEDVVLEHFGVK